jgi:hypothetical protein
MSELPLFDEYLLSKKIDANAFKKAENELYLSLKDIYDQVSPKSFTSQKLYLINPLRRKYLSQVMVEKPKPKPKMMRPKIAMPKPKMK